MEKYNNTIERYREELEGWGFSFSSTKSPRAFSSNLPTRGSLSSNESTTNHPKEDSEWCYYAGMPSPSAYTNNLER